MISLGDLKSLMTNLSSQKVEVTLTPGEVVSYKVTWHGVFIGFLVTVGNPEDGKFEWENSGG